MRSEKTRSSLTRPLASAMILLACGLACSAANAEPNAQAELIEGVQIQGRSVQAVRIDDAQAASSTGSVQLVSGIETPYYFTNKIVIQATDWDAINAVINARPDAQLGQWLGEKGRFRVIETPSVGTAFEVKRVLEGVDGVLSSEVDAGRVPQVGYVGTSSNARESILRSRLAAAPAKSKGYQNAANSGIGIKPYDPDSNPASIPASQWHFTNAATPDHDNNILESIFSTDMLTGAGVTIGYATTNNRRHLDVDHTELVDAGRSGGYKLALSQAFDPVLDDDDTFLTGEAGIMIAERDNPVTVNDLQGVSPDASLLTIFRGPTPLLESQAYEWELNTVDIRVNEIAREYDFLDPNYNANYQNSFVTQSYKNSLRFGRGRKGTINVFGAGSGFNFTFGVPTNLLADPYTFTSEPWDVFTGTTNTVGVSLTNAFLTGPFYVGGHTSRFTLANEHNSLIIGRVSEDGNIGTFGAVGPGIFASFYAGSNNEFWSGAQGISGRGISTIVAGTQPPGSVAGEGPVGLLPAAGTAVIGNTTEASIAAGVIALMLDENPQLKVRDIRHIFFESIQESMRADTAKWPNFDSARGYYSPGAGQTGFASFWQPNSALYNNANPPTTVPPTDPVVNQAIRHSDQYGFGVVDVNLAIQKAKSWTGVAPLILLDSGIVGDVQDPNRDAEDDARVPLVIEDATFSDADPEADGNVPVVTGASTLLPGLGVSLSFCVRPNIKIESIVVELTIEGEGNNDLYIELVSPTATRSILSIPTTRNLTGQTTDALNDDELDDGFFYSGGFADTQYAFYQHPILTNKHWGEFSGGTWSLTFQDFGPDTDNPEGAEPGDDLATEPGADMVVDLGEIGIPGSSIRSAKTVQAFRVKIYGTDIGEPTFLGCNAAFTSCPGDLNGDGIINVADLQMFINWYQNGDSRGDVNNDGQLDFADVQFYLSIFDVGYCVSSGSPPLIGGRPIPGGPDASDTNPTTRPF